MSVRKRKWRTSGGAIRESWLVAYRDSAGQRRFETFDHKRGADARHAEIKGELRRGVHAPISASPTIADMAEVYLNACAAAGLEPTTLATYDEHNRLQIAPFLGRVKLATLTSPMVHEYLDRLREAGRSPALIKKVLVRLGAILGEAQTRGLVAQNVVKALTRLRGREQAERRARSKLRVAVDIPSPDEIRRLIARLSGRHRVLILAATFTGLRSSELRGLRWADVDLRRGELHVRQRADRLCQIGRPKSAAGERTVPLPPLLLNVLKEHKLASQHELDGSELAAAEKLLCC